MMECGSSVYVALEEQQECPQCKRQGFIERLEHEVCCYCCQEITVEEEEKYVAEEKDKKQRGKEAVFKILMKTKNLEEVVKSLREIEERLDEQEIKVRSKETRHRTEYHLRMIRKKDEPDAKKEQCRKGKGTN